MKTWTIDDLYRLDAKFAAANVHLHQRPLRAAAELLGSSFNLVGGMETEASQIMAAYKALIPEVDATWPGLGIGLAVSVDRIRKVTLPVVYGQVRLESWRALGFQSADEWRLWCRGRNDIALDSDFACLDALDFAIGLRDLGSQNAKAEPLWHMARSNLEDIANILPSTFSVDSVLQPICLVAELAIKGTLVWTNVDPDRFRRDGKRGHDLKALAKEMASARPHRDDPLVETVISKLPPYVDSRYAPANWSRLEVAQVALGVQFIAASSLRRISGLDLAALIEPGVPPTPRQAFFRSP